MFDHIEQARAALEGAIDFAQRHGLNQVVFHAERALGDLKDGVSLVVPEQRANSPMVEQAAQGVRRMREMAGIRD
jgi:hypothetical protein